MATERSYISDIEKIATLAKDNAQEAGRLTPKLADIEAAMADVLPPAAAPKPVRKGLQTHRKSAHQSRACKSSACAEQRPMQADAFQCSTRNNAVLLNAG